MTSSKSQWYPHVFIDTPVLGGGVLQLQQVRGGCMWITSCVRAGQREVTRSNVKCMYCNKHVQLKRALVILLDFLGLPHNAECLVESLTPPPTTFSLFLFDQQEEIFNKRVMHRLFLFLPACSIPLIGLSPCCWRAGSSAAYRPVCFFSPHHSIYWVYNWTAPTHSVKLTTSLLCILFPEVYWQMK